MAQIPEIELELLPVVEETIIEPARSRSSISWEVVRFAIVGVANTAIDLLVLNCLLILLPTQSAGLLVVYNSVAYGLGAFNSFLLNKYWTFQRNQTAAKGELLRFALVNVLGLFCNNGILWLATTIVQPLMGSGIVSVNISKVLAIIGTAIISFLGMRLWVFTGQTRQRRKRGIVSMLARAFRELFTYAYKWHWDERMAKSNLYCEEQALESEDDTEKMPAVKVSGYKTRFANAVKERVGNDG